MDGVDGGGGVAAEGAEGGRGAAGRGVEQRGVVPARQRRAVGVVLQPPPEQAVGIPILLKRRHQVGHELGLTGLAVGPGLRVVVRGAGNFPFVAVARLNYHDILGREIGLHRLQRTVQDTHVAVEIGIVAQADYVVRNVQLLHLVVEILQHVNLSHTLGVQDDLGLGTHLMTRLDSLLQQIAEPCPVGIAAHQGLPRAGGAGRSPQHAVTDLIAGLDERRNHAVILQLRQYILGIVIDPLIQLFVGQVLPVHWRPLLGRVGPCVAVMEVQHQVHAAVHDTLAQRLDILQVLAGVRVISGIGICIVLMQFLILRRIDEQAHAHGVHPLLVEPGNQVGDRFAGWSHVLCSSLLIFGQQGYVATHVTLRRHSRQSRHAQERGGQEGFNLHSLST